jgi:hypothetical protein
MRQTNHRTELRVGGSSSTPAVLWQRGHRVGVGVSVTQKRGAYQKLKTSRGGPLTYYKILQAHVLATRGPEKREI